MSTQELASSTAPANLTGLASGLNTNEIITAMMSAERRPVTQMTNQETTLQAQQTQLRTLQSSLQSLAFSAADLSTGALFETTQTVTSSNPDQITAQASTGAGVGGYELEVTQLANSAQRSFTFTSPTSADTITIDGHEIAIKAGATIKEVADAINSDSSATVYAAALEEGTLVLSDRATGATGEGFIAVTDPGGTLVEQAGKAKQGQDAEYTVDGVAGTSTSNTVKNAIAGVTLSLAALTTTSGPVTINVSAPAASTSAITAQVESFVKQYNSVLSALHTQVNTKPPEHPSTAAELGTGTLFGDIELVGLGNAMRESVYTPVAGLPTEMASLADIGISTGEATGGGTPSEGSVEGQLTVNTKQLAEAIQANPAGVEQMLEKWTQGFQQMVNVSAEPGGTMETRITGDGESAKQIGEQVTALNEMLEIRQKSLEAQFVAMETAVSENQSQLSWITSQVTAMTANSVS